VENVAVVICTDGRSLPPHRICKNGVALSQARKAGRLKTVIRCLQSIDVGVRQLGSEAGMWRQSTNRWTQTTARVVRSLREQQLECSRKRRRCWSIPGFLRYVTKSLYLSSPSRIADQESMPARIIARRKAANVYLLRTFSSTHLIEISRLVS
jgi:hypothetical protein